VACGICCKSINSDILERQKHVHLFPDIACSWQMALDDLKKSNFTGIVRLETRLRWLEGWVRGKAIEE
jgi:hypothetical protein